MHNKDLSELQVISKDVARLISELSAAIVDDRGSSSKIRNHLLEYERKLKQLEESTMAMNNLEQAVTSEALQGQGPDATSTAPVPGTPAPVDGSQGQDAAVTRDPALANELKNTSNPQQLHAPADEQQPQASADKNNAMPKNEHGHKHKNVSPDQAHRKDSTPVDKSLHQNVSESGS